MSSTIKNVLCKTCLILIVGFTFLTASYAHAQQQTVVLHVDGDNGLAVPNPPDPGDTWSNAYKYLPDALDRAEFLILNDPQVDAVDLWVAATVPNNPYRPDRDAANEGGTGDRSATFLIDFNNVQVLGGFPPGGGDLDDRDPAMYETVLSGEITYAVCGDPGAGECDEDNGTPGCNDADCCETVCSVDPDCCEVEWDQGCANTANNLCDTCGPGNGDCFEPNGTPGCDDAKCCAAVCEIDPICCILEWDETCADIAEGICPVLGNNAYHVVTADGVDDSVRIDGFKITLGFADGITGNDGVGAGMFILDASLAVVRVTFTENLAPGHGGGAMHIGGTAHPLVVNCSMTANDGTFGGALHIDPAPASATLVNCLISGNTADSGGGIDARSDSPATLDLINCTLTDNTAQNVGGGLWVVGTIQVTVTNSILWGNMPNQITGTATVTYSDVEGGWAGEGNLDPPLDPLFVDPVNGDYRLDDLSPCIDFGDTNEGVIPADMFDIDNDDNDLEPTPDLDLNNRVLDGDQMGGDRVDMGAYEFCHPDSCPWDLDGGGFVGAGDLLLLLADWGNPYGAGDLLGLLAAWGACPCFSFEPPSLAEELTAACLTQQNWQDFLDALETGSSAEQANYICWLTHYFEDCNRCICIGASGCPGADPFDD